MNHMTKNLFISGVMCLVSFNIYSQTLKEMTEMDKRFAPIDKAVLLIEKYNSVALTNSVSMPLPIEGRSFCDIVIGLTGGKMEHCKSTKTINQFVFTYIDTLQKSIPSIINGAWNLHLQNLYHHTKKLFNQTNINKGNDFDENLLSIYHQYRINTQTYLDVESLREANSELLKSNTLLDSKLTVAMECINDLKLQTNIKLKTLQDSLNSMYKRDNQIMVKQEKSSVSDQFFNRGRNKYAYERLPDSVRQQVLGDNPESYRKTRRNLKRKIKDAAKNSVPSVKQR